MNEFRSDPGEWRAAIVLLLVGAVVAWCFRDAVERTEAELDRRERELLQCEDSRR